MLAMDTIEPALTLTTAGLAFDGFGVLVLGYAFFSKSLPKLRDESASVYGGANLALLHSLIQQRTDGIAGTSLLFVGFLLQWLGAANITHVIAAAVLYGLLVLLLVLHFGVCRHRVTQWQYERAKEAKEAKEAENAGGE